MLPLDWLTPQPISRTRLANSHRASIPERPTFKSRKSSRASRRCATAHYRELAKYILDQPILDLIEEIIVSLLGRDPGQPPATLSKVKQGAGSSVGIRNMT
jgi:hypothetical protein